MMKLSTVVKKVLRLAEAIQSYWEVELPKRYANYPFVNPGEEDGPPPPEEKKLRDLLATLPDDYVYKLALIAYIGRGSLDAADLERGYAEIKERYENAEETARNLFNLAPLGDCISDGLAEFEKRNFDLDQWTLTASKAKK